MPLKGFHQPAESPTPPRLPVGEKEKGGSSREGILTCRNLAAGKGDGYKTVSPCEAGQRPGWMRSLPGVCDFLTVLWEETLEFPREDVG